MPLEAGTVTVLVNTDESVTVLVLVTVMVLVMTAQLVTVALLAEVATSPPELVATDTP